mgnify:CR=1 FL=1
MEQGALIQVMIENELRQNDAPVSISNHRYENPKIIKLQADEMAFISMIRIDAQSDFVLNYHSVTEYRTIKKLVALPVEIENNIVTKHLSSIHFEIDNGDPFEVSIIKLKTIK